MDVILLQRVEKLGRIGDIVSVKPGYARNYLLPTGRALRATDANKARFEAQRAHIEAENARKRDEAVTVAKTMTDVSVILIRQASNAGALYGSVSAKDIAEALTAIGHRIGREAVILDRPIKTLGITEVRLVLHPEVTVTATVNTARSPEEAELQAQGVDVTADRFAEEEAAAEEAAAKAEAEAEAEAEAGTDTGEAAAESSEES